MTIRLRYFRAKHYLYVYNVLYRYCRNTERMKQIVDWMHRSWENFSESEKRFILSKEEW